MARYVEGHEVMDYHRLLERAGLMVRRADRTHGERGIAAAAARDRRLRDRGAHPVGGAVGIPPALASLISDCSWRRVVCEYPTLHRSSGGVDQIARAATLQLEADARSCPHLFHPAPRNHVETIRGRRPAGARAGARPVSADPLHADDFPRRTRTTSRSRHASRPTAPAGRADDGGLDAGLVPGARVRAQRRSRSPPTSRRHRRSASRRRQEPLADRDRRRCRRSRALPRLRPRDDASAPTASTPTSRSSTARRRSSRWPTIGVRVRHEVTLELPAGWKTSITALPDAPGGVAHRYRAPDYDTLVDSPIVAGQPGGLRRSRCRGKPHFLVNVGEGGVWDGAADGRRRREDRRDAVAGILGLVAVRQVRLLQPDHRAHGGLEHKNSCDADDEPLGNAHATRLSSTGSRCVSHEFFHAWNVKRLRPAELGPFDYEREIYTRSLWVAEGFTDYYGDLLAVARRRLDAAMSISARCRQRSRAADHARPAGRSQWRGVVRRLDQVLPPGRELAQHLDQLLHQRRGDGVPARRRDSARHQRRAESLDDVMRLAYSGTPARAVSRRTNFARWPRKWPARISARGCTQALGTTTELDYSRTSPGLASGSSNDAPSTPRAWLGLTLTGAAPTLKNDGGRLVVAQVRRGSPAYDAGVNVDDEILAIDDYRVRPEGWEARLDAYRPGDRVQASRRAPRAHRPDRRGICAGTGASDAYRARPGGRRCQPRTARDMVEAVTVSRLF